MVLPNIMTHQTIWPQSFHDEAGGPSMEFLSQYCQFPTTKKFIYNDTILGNDFNELRFNNIVKANGVKTNDIVNQLPDLENVGNISYYVNGTPDIGKLESAEIFTMSFYYTFNIDKKYPVFNDYVKIIDGNTLIINGKKLNVSIHWMIGPAFYYLKHSQTWQFAFISNENYKLFEL